MPNVTMQDLATTLGVARSTVSRALRADRQIAPATRERIKQLAREIDYYPNAIARALHRHGADAVGLLLQRRSSFVFANPYFSELLQGLSEVAEGVGFDDISLAAMVKPPLMTARQPARELGEYAMKTMLTLLTSKERARPLCLETEPVVRGSTGSSTRGGVVI